MDATTSARDQREEDFTAESDALAGRDYETDPLSREKPLWSITWDQPSQRRLSSVGADLRRAGWRRIGLQGWERFPNSWGGVDDGPEGDRQQKVEFGYMRLQIVIRSLNAFRWAPPPDLADWPAGVHRRGRGRAGAHQHGAVDVGCHHQDAEEDGPDDGALQTQIVCSACHGQTHAGPNQAVGLVHMTQRFEEKLDPRNAFSP
ncbi:hypothetical protein EYF80_014011 [Liparis tanakae]|uniref:Uncharacterized protein n=1 Tax=Liparis tanakae TaxID=230148 RepID=A0A4Z2IC88_9TELE|nr:hypothetical protein EYF80_014011 [Liparis tanakae]